MKKTTKKGTGLLTLSLDDLSRVTGGTSAPAIVVTGQNAQTGQNYEYTSYTGGTTQQGQSVAVMQDTTSDAQTQWLLNHPGQVWPGGNGNGNSATPATSRTPPSSGRRG